MDTHPSSPRTELDLMTEHELARHLKICRRQLYNWRVAGLIPYFKMGKAVRFRVADVAAAIERMRVGGTAPSSINHPTTSSGSATGCCRC